MRRTTVRVPAGNSWGTPVRRGTSVNVIAEPAGFDPRRPHRLVVAHLDTIPVAPGAEDNASGVSVMLELARMAAAERPALPTRFIAFGAEEPRGPGDALHHFGSQQLVADTSRAERDAIDGVVSLDRVGVRAGYVPVCRSPLGGQGLQRDVRAAAAGSTSPPGRARTPPATTGRTRRPACRASGSAASSTTSTTPAGTSTPSSTGVSWTGSATWSGRGFVAG